jgi:hypothetical protein
VSAGSRFHSTDVIEALDAATTVSAG